MNRRLRRNVVRGQLGDRQFAGHVEADRHGLGAYSAEQGVWATIEGADTDTFVVRTSAGEESELCRRLADRL